MRRLFFISYKSQEFEQASAVKRTLEDAGMPCWMAPDSIEPGSEYGRQITDAIRNCDALVLVLSALSQTSMPVLSEVDLAMSFKKTVIPFHLDESELTDAFLFRLGIFQRIEAARDLEDAYGDLVERARKVLEERAKEDPTQVGDSRGSASAGGRAIERRPKASVRASEGVAPGARTKTAEPADKGQLAKGTAILFLLMMVAYGLFMWLTTLDAAYDMWQTYVAVGLALVLNNDFTVGLYQLFALWEQDTTGWLRRLLQSPARPLVVLGLTVPAAIVAGYTDATASALPANAAATALMVLVFCVYMELSKLVAAKAPLLAKRIGQAAACAVFAIVSFVLIILLNLEVRGFSVMQILSVIAVTLCIVAFGGLLALPCNAAYRYARKLISNKG